MQIKVLVIRTDFKHHGANSGYKQILKYIKPYKVIGFDYRNGEHLIPLMKKRYPWLFEFEAFKLYSKVDLIHIFYGEIYFRWSSFLFKKTPVVVTFHEPAELLEKEVNEGGGGGRISKITHFLTKKRFSKLSAAIVTNSSQKEVLKKVMPEEKIHIIPLGIHLDDTKKKFEKYSINKASLKARTLSIITVGHYLRDWDFYFEIVEACPDWKFCIVNRMLEDKYIKLAEKYKNLTYYSNISDDELFDLFLDASLQFIPVTGMAASNALIQGLSLGCPLVLTDINAEQFKNDKSVISLYKRGDIKDCIVKISSILDLSQKELTELQNLSHQYSYQFSWEEIANKTIKLYKQLV